MQPSPPCMPNVRRWRGLGGCGPQACHLSGEAAGLTGHQMDGQHPNWAVPTPPPPSPPPRTSAAVTPCRSSPMGSPPGALLAQSCTRPPSLPWLGTPSDTWPARTRAVPPRSWGWTSSPSSRGSGGPSPWRTAPKRRVRTNWMHRSGHPAALGAPRAARLAGRQRRRPPRLLSFPSRVGI